MYRKFNGIQKDLKCIHENLKEFKLIQWNSRYRGNSDEFDGIQADLG